MVQNDVEVAVPALDIESMLLTLSRPSPSREVPPPATGSELIRLSASSAVVSGAGFSGPSIEGDGGTGDDSSLNLAAVGVGSPMSSPSGARVGTGVPSVSCAAAATAPGDTVSTNELRPPCLPISDPNDV